MIAAHRRSPVALMANTRYLTTEVEDHVRKVLRKRFGTPFRKRVLDLTTGGRHEFDAVSDEGTIVASIKATSGKTADGKIPNGKDNNAVTEIYLFIACRSTAANARAYVPAVPRSVGEEDRWRADRWRDDRFGTAFRGHAERGGSRAGEGQQEVSVALAEAAAKAEIDS